VQPKTHTDYKRECNTKNILLYFIVKRQYFNILMILQIERNEMGWACSADGVGKSRVHGFGG